MRNEASEPVRGHINPLNVERGDHTERTIVCNATHTPANRPTPVRLNIGLTEHRCQAAVFLLFSLALHEGPGTRRQLEPTRLRINRYG